LTAVGVTTGNHDVALAPRSALWPLAVRRTFGRGELLTAAYRSIVPSSRRFTAPPPVWVTDFGNVVVLANSFARSRCTADAALAVGRRLPLAAPAVALAPLTTSPAAVAMMIAVL
jgi:hypothetical protein